LTASTDGKSIPLITTVSRPTAAAASGTGATTLTTIGVHLAIEATRRRKYLIRDSGTQLFSTHNNAGANEREQQGVFDRGNCGFIGPETIDFPCQITSHKILT
jgi:hypothetical protein